MSDEAREDFEPIRTECLTRPRCDDEAPAWIAALLEDLSVWAARHTRGRARGTDRSHLQDLAQETICRMLARYGHDELAALPTQVLRAIAWRVLKNLVIDESRRWRPRAIRQAIDPVDPDAPADVRFELSRARERLDAALMTLSRREREFLLAAMRLDSVPAAQRAVGWPRASPYYRLTLLLERLRDELVGPRRY